MPDTQKTLRILTLLENNPYLADPIVRPQMEALATAGYKVTVVCPRLDEQTQHESINGVQVHRFRPPVSAASPAAYLIEFLHASIIMTLLTLWIWKRNGLDVLHHYNPPDTLFLAGMLPKLAGKVIVYSIRDLAPELYQSKYESWRYVIRQSLQLLERISCRQADHIIVVNETYKRIIVHLNGVPPQRVTVVRQGPDPDRVHPVQPDTELSARARIIFAYLGNMAKQDGVDHILRALHYLDQNFNYHDWYCVLVGRADNPQSLRELAGKFGLAERICFTGYQPLDRWAPLLSAADICIEPAPERPHTRVSTMLKLMDYMAMGKLTVAYDLPEHHVTARESALYAHPNNEIDLASKMKYLVDHPSVREYMGMIGRKRIEEKLGWHCHKQHLLDLYSSIRARFLRWK